MMDLYPSIYVSCICGCEDTIHFTAAHGILYAAFLRSEFYSEQRPIRTALKERLKYLFTKNRDLREVLTSRAMLEQLRDFLAKVSFTEYDTTSNLSVINVDHVWSDVHSLILTAKVPKNWSWRGRLHRVFDMELNSADRDRLVAAIDAVLAEPMDEAEFVSVVEGQTDASENDESVAEECVQAEDSAAAEQEV